MNTLGRLDYSRVERNIEIERGVHVKIVVYRGLHQSISWEALSLWVQR